MLYVVWIIVVLMDLIKAKPLNNIAAWADAVTICHDHCIRKILETKGTMGVLHQQRQQGQGGVDWKVCTSIDRLFLFCAILF